MKRLLVALALILFAVGASHSPTKAQSVAARPCNSSVVYDASTNGSTALVSSINKSIYICGYGFFAAGTVNVKLIYGTGTTCGTGTVSLTPAYQFTAQTGFVDPSPFFRGMFVPKGNDLCINTSAGQAVQAVIYYVAQ